MDLINEQLQAKEKALAAFGVTTDIKSLLQTKKNELNKAYAKYYLDVLEEINNSINIKL